MVTALHIIKNEEDDDDDDGIGIRFIQIEGK